MSQYDDDADRFVDNVDREDWQQDEFSICRNASCQHPFCPEDSEFDPWTGEELNV
jgi:hypothetical protein